MVNLGLFSSNWTEMDLRFKKTMLLAMIMNSCHKRIMKMTPTSIINLEMFGRVSMGILKPSLNQNNNSIKMCHDHFQVMKMSYSVLPLLLNMSARNKQ